MSGSRPTLDEFKSRLPLVDIVAKHVKLTRKAREWQGLCPFHKEKSPSFAVVEDKGFYHCFGCGAHGNAIDFIMQIEHLDFADALQRLEELTGIPAPRREGPAEPKVDQDLYAINQLAADWYVAQLAGGIGREARAYLATRGLRPDLIETFGLGYAPGTGRALLEALQARGIALGRLAEAGLVLIDEEGGRAPVDRFRHRLLFPIRDERGRVVGFGGRALGDAKPKYLNTGETTLFKKGDLLYGLDLALPAARARRRVVVVEGYMDVIAMHEAGVPVAVAPLGTALGERQLARLWKLSPAPVLCFDGDEAGRRAAGRAAERALPLLTPDHTLSVAFLPPGEDPDTLLRTRGAAAVTEILDGAIPLVDFLWTSATAGRAIDTPERRAALRRDAVEQLKAIADQGLQRQYIAEFRQRLDRLMPFRPGRGRELPMPGTAGGQIQPFDAIERMERGLLRPVLDEPRLLGQLEEDLAAYPWRIPHHLAIVSVVLEWYALILAEDADSVLDGTRLRHHLAQSGLGEHFDRILADRSSGSNQRRAMSDELVLEQWTRLRGKDAQRARARAAFGAALSGRGSDSAE